MRILAVVTAAQLRERWHASFGGDQGGFLWLGGRGSRVTGRLIIAYRHPGPCPKSLAVSENPRHRLMLSSRGLSLGD